MSLTILNKIPQLEVMIAVKMVAVGVLLSVTALLLKGSLTSNAPILLLLILFYSSYVVKFLLIALDLNSPFRLGMIPNSNMEILQTFPFLRSSFDLSLYGITAFCLTLITLLAFKKIKSIDSVENLTTVAIKNNTFYRLLIAALLFSGFTLALTYIFDIGLMGATHVVESSYFIVGITYYARTFLIPGILLMLAFIAIKERFYYSLFALVIALVINGLGDSIIRSSKSSLLLPFLYAFLLITVCGFRLKNRIIYVFLLFFPLILMIFPYINAVRGLRNSGLDAFSAVYVALNEINFTPIEFIISWFIWLIYRIPGIDILFGLLIKSKSITEKYWLDIFSYHNGVPGYLTNHFFEVSASSAHLYAPGYFGWWYLISGTPGIIAGGIILGLIVMYGWPLILKINLLSFPVIRIFFLFFLLMVSSDGAIDLLIKPLIAAAFTIFLLEIGLRFVAKQKLAAE